MSFLRMTLYLIKVKKKIEKLFTIICCFGKITIDKYRLKILQNYEMQEYMLERRERKSSEDGPDKVMKSIRNIIREKEELH